MMLIAVAMLHSLRYMSERQSCTLGWTYDQGKAAGLLIQHGGGTCVFQNSSTCLQR